MVEQQTDRQAALQRLVTRRQAVAAVALLSLVFAVFGGLPVAWSVAGTLAVLLWGALWPLSPTSAGVASVGTLAGSIGSVFAAELQAAAPKVDANVWERVLAGVPDAAVMLDRDSRVLAANAEARALLPVSNGRHISLASRAPEVLAAVERARTSNEPQTFQVRTTVPVKRLLLGFATPIAADAAHARAGAGEPAQILVLRDQTAAQHLVQLRADFVANASHELRTPLASLKGFVETLQGPAKGDPEAAARFLPIMQAQAERMSRLIDDLLSLSRIEMREHLPPSDPVDLAGVADEVVNALQLAAQTAGMTISLTRGADRAMVTGDREELIQVVQNLVQNAIKYGRPGGRVDIAVTSTTNRLAVAVADDGIGIEPEHLPRLTERFYRVSAKDSRERGGTGLGLAIVKHIVNRHQGELRVASRPGEGSTFTVLLPRRDAAR